MYKSVESMIGDCMKKWKTISAIAMTAAALLCSGCGNPTMLEEYSFGYVQLKKGDSEVYLQTPFDLGRIDTKDEADNYMNYLKTKFARFLLQQIAMTQHLSRSTFGYIPVQDFKQYWNDKRLYVKYGLTEDEINFIEKLIKEMA